jgi:transcription initiation protein SPT3
MMYIAGETQDASDDTTNLIEDIIHGQVVHLVCDPTHGLRWSKYWSNAQLTTASDLAFRRGSRIFTVADLIFQFRHDTARVDRLRTFLVWKAIRKTAKGADDKDGVEDEEPEVDVAQGMKAIPTVNLPWDPPSYFSQQLPDADDAAADALTSAASLEKLQRDDERTRGMTLDEYATWSEYRHASFTWRKVKRFRVWSGLGVIAEHRHGDDVLDVLGFITSEMVKTLTIEAMAAQSEEGRGVDVATSSKTAVDGLFGTTMKGRDAVKARHVRVAFQRLQAVPKKRRAMLVGTRLPTRQGLQLVSLLFDEGKALRNANL